MRTVIVGIPGAGKTTMALELRDQGRRVRHTDDLVGSHTWSDASAEVATWFAEPGDWVVEGVTAVRALRKWMAANPGGRPCDEVVWRGNAYRQLGPHQAAMAKGCETVWAEVKPELVRRGVKVSG